MGSQALHDAINHILWQVRRLATESMASEIVRLRMQASSSKNIPIRR